MRKIKVHVSTNRVGSGDYKEFEVDEGASVEYIEELAREEMFDMIEWYWEEIEEENKQ